MQRIVGFFAIGVIIASCAPAPNTSLVQEAGDDQAQIPTATENTDPAYAAEPTFTIESIVPAIREMPDLSMLPIGDGKTSNSPEVGSMWMCDMPEGGGGAMATGAWFDEANGIYNLLIRPTVDGEVTWASHVTITVEGNLRIITSNGLPDHTTGNFPVDPSDDAYAYDRNPHAIEAQSFRLELQANPQLTSPSCVGGEVGISIDGVVINNGFDAAERDAVAHEIQDACFGHPHQGGVYHYHGYSPCLEDQIATGASALIGYALDGFGIYGPYDENGQVLTSADLDECHGRTSLIEWDGQMVEMYHYVATYDFPYTLGCFRGTAVRFLTSGGEQQGGQLPSGDGPPATPSGGGNPPPPPPQP